MGKAQFETLRADAFAIWLEWLVTIHKPRRLKKLEKKRRVASILQTRLAWGPRCPIMTIVGDKKLECGWLQRWVGDAKIRKIVAGEWHVMTLRDDGTVWCWGYNAFGQAPHEAVVGDFVAIAAGGFHSLALRRDGSIVCWGDNSERQAPPEGIKGEFTTIAAGVFHSLALRRDGSVACWGDNTFHQAPPEGVSGNDFVAIAAGGYHSLALRRDGGIVCWGRNSECQAPPDGVAGVFVAIAAGNRFSLGLRYDGCVVVFGEHVPLKCVAGEFVSIVAGLYPEDLTWFGITDSGTVACYGDEADPLDWSDADGLGNGLGLRHVYTGEM